MEVLCYRGGKMNEKIKKYSPYILFIIVIVLMIVGIVSKKEDDLGLDFSINTENERIIENVYIYVDLKGAVKNPGVYKLEKDSRMFQVIQLAGGLTVDADENAINMSIMLSDQDAVYIPTIDEEYPIITIVEDNGIGGIININSATVESLQTLPGIGPSTAQKIIDYRSEIGLFETIEDIMNVSGIGESTYNEIKDLITT